MSEAPVQATPADPWAGHYAVLADSHAVPNIDCGRNIKGGYSRGMALEFGNLAAHLVQDPVYLEALGHADRRNALCLPHKLMNLYLLMRFGLPGIEGDIIELGSYRGGSAVFMASLARRLGLPVRVWALDSFEGMPTTDLTRDAHRKGDFADTSYDDLVRYAADNGLAEHMTVVKGYFNDTLEPVAAKAGRFSLVHVDCDIYDAVKYSLRTLESRVGNGAYVVFDDPLHSSCIGAMQALEEELIGRLGLRAEQTYPHLVYRLPYLPSTAAARA